jgi:hypothetical protein
MQIQRQNPFGSGQFEFLRTAEKMKEIAAATKPTGTPTSKAGIGSLGLEEYANKSTQ